MKIVHSFGGKQIEKNIKNDAGFLLTDGSGGYLSLSDYPSSRYQGWFVSLGDKVFKIIENLEIQKKPSVKEIKNNFWNIKRKRGNIAESFFLPHSYNSLAYEISEPADIEIILDIRESYGNPEFGRKYEIFEEKKVIIIKYEQTGERPVYLAVKPDNLNWLKPEKWISRYYQLDEKRSSPPFEKYVFKALKLKCEKIVFSVSENKKEALDEARKVFRNLKNLKKIEEKRIEKSVRFKKRPSGEMKMALLCAQNSLNGLAVAGNKKVGLYAGLPWFFQFWTRDEAISLKSFAGLNPKLAKKILFRMIKSVGKDGRPPNISFGTKFPAMKTADGAGWIFKRTADFISNKQFNKKEILEIKKCVKQAVKGLLKHHTKDGLAVSGPKETWMDTADRSGARIEIQALRLNIYNLAYRLTREKQYSDLEKQLRKQVREKFWNGKILADGLDYEGKNDLAIRPNIFIAAYAYPKLLSKKEWEKCFENILPKLWLKWGGLATIGKKSPLFSGRHTGEDPKSYHNGDSWFYINNLTALVLYKINKRKFKKYIDKILEASAKEILYMGVIGHHSELSSAGKLGSEGCQAQAWSNALFIEAAKNY